MKKTLGFCLGLGLSLYVYAQDTLSKSKNLDEVIIYSNKFAERKKNIVQKIHVITERQIAQTNSQNTGDLLMNTGNVFVQKSQQGGSSPVIRGFEASRVLLVIDGIRMNNAIYRSGHLQNAITVDQNMLERVEVLYGPASTIYGSDALGGVVHFRTKMPKLSLTGKTLFTGSAFARYSTANKEKTVHLDVSAGGKRFGWLQSYNFSDFGDTRMGGSYLKKYPNFGRRSQYVATINGIDSIVKNSDDRIQKFSGYSQWDITQKLLFKQSDKTSHTLNLQYSNSTNVPRYDRLQDVRSGRLRFAEWYYGPQLRGLAAYELNKESEGFFNSIKASLNYQYIEESRHQRDYRRYDRLDNRMEKVHVWAFGLDGRKVWKNHEITLGVDGQLNDVTSRAVRKNIITGAVSPLDTRYPNGDNKLNNVGAYGQHTLKMKGGRWVLNDGIRVQATALRSTIADNSFFNLPFTKIEQENLAFTGNLGIIYIPTSDFRLAAGLSSGFRAPNVDDAARIFESNTASRQLVVPNPDIQPEYTYNGDISIAKTIAQKVRFEATGYYTLFRNAISLAPFRLHGQDSVDYNGTRVKVLANRNINKAFLYGFNASISADLSEALVFSFNINYTYGRLQPAVGTEVPLDHIPPLFGRTGIIYTHKIVTIDAYALYNGWKRIKDYNPSGEDNAQYATADGTPSWFTLNLKSAWVINQHISLQAGIENILDRNYRYFASGFSAPGRNIMLSLRGRL